MSFVCSLLEELSSSLPLTIINNKSRLYIFFPGVCSSFRFSKTGYFKPIQNVNLKESLYIVCSCSLWLWEFLCSLLPKSITNSANIIALSLQYKSDSMVSCMYVTLHSMMSVCNAEENICVIAMPRLLVS